MFNSKFKSFLLVAAAAFASSTAVGQERQGPIRTFPDSATQTRKPIPLGAKYAKWDGVNSETVEYNGGPEPQMCPKDSAGKPRANAPKGCVIEWLDPTLKTLPEKEDEVLVSGGNVQDKSASGITPPEPKAGIGLGKGMYDWVVQKPASSTNGSSQSTRRRQPTRKPVNTDRPTEEVGVSNPSGKPIKNATTRPKSVVKQNPNDTPGGDKPKDKPDAPPADQAFTGYLKIEGVKDASVDTPRSAQTTDGQTSRTRRPKTQTQRPPNGPVGKPKRPDLKPIKREAIENPVDINPPASEMEVSRQRNPNQAQDKLGNFEIQGMKKPTTHAQCQQQLDQEIKRTKLTPPKTVTTGLSECQQQLDWIAAAHAGRTEAVTGNETVTRSRRPSKAPARSTDAKPAVEEITFATGGDTRKATPKSTTAPKRKPAVRRTVKKPN